VHVTTNRRMSGILGAAARNTSAILLIVQVGRKDGAHVARPQGLVEPVNDVLLRIDATIATRPEFNPLTTSRHFFAGCLGTIFDQRPVARSVYGVYIGRPPGIYQSNSARPAKSAAAELEAGEGRFHHQPREPTLAHASPAPCCSKISYMIVVDAGNTEVGGLDRDRAVPGGCGHVGLQKAAKFGLPQLEKHGWQNRYGDGAQRGKSFHTAFSLLPRLVIGTSRNCHDAYQGLAKQCADNPAGSPGSCLHSRFRA